MDKQFDFSKFENQQEIFETAQTESADMKILVGYKGTTEDYETAKEILDDVKKAQLSKEIIRLEGELIDNKRKARIARSDDAREVYEEKVALCEKDLRQAKQAIDKMEYEAKKKERKDKFDEFLKGKCDDFKNGKFETILPGIDSIVMQKNAPDQKSGEINSVLVIPYWHKNGREYSVTCTLTEKDGLLIGTPNGKLPQDLKFTKEELHDEVLSIAESVDLDFFENVGNEILPPDDWQSQKGEYPWIEQPIDRRRLRFMKDQPNVLFGINGANSGFRGYYGFVFQKFLVLENDQVGNAAYFFDFDSPLEVNQERFKLPPKRRMNKTERDNILQNNWQPIADFTKSELKILGGEDKRHPVTTMDDDHWKDIMQAEIDSRS